MRQRVWSTRVVLTFAALSARPALAADPVIGPPFAVGDGRSGEVTVATGSQGFAMGWVADGEAKVQLLDERGAVRSAVRLVEGGTTGYSWGAAPTGRPEVVALGESYWVSHEVRSHARSTPAPTFTPRGALITGAGCSAEPRGPLSSHVDDTGLVVAGSRGGALVAAWYIELAGSIIHERLAVRAISLDGTLGEARTVHEFAFDLQAGPPPGYIRTPLALASDGTSYLLVWGLDARMSATRIPSTGEISTLEAPTSLHLPGYHESRGARMAWNGSVYLFVWSDEGGSIRVARIDADGTVLDADGTIVASGSVIDLDSAGDETLLLYAPASADGGIAQLRGLRLDAGGASLDPEGVPLAVATGGAAAAAGDRLWLSVFDGSNQGRFIGSDGVPEAPPSGTAPPLSCPDVPDAGATVDTAQPAGSDAATPPSGDAASEPTDAGSTAAVDASAGNSRGIAKQKNSSGCSYARGTGDPAAAAWLLLLLGLVRRRLAS